ncbi:hypothetical protein WJX74_002573 [Apatococcus lobatus]|uniref:CRAL-TRIO domain-containing protein n=1 Tax=Apatococcus lobatus TaxID=904363 RepID=A0AAW1REK0_9CHLO
MFWGSKVEHTDDSKQKALLELRSKLASTDTYEQLLAGREPGVTQSSEMDDKTLSRWLVAEEWNVSKAFQRLSYHAPWRARNFPAGRIQEKDIKGELEARKAFLQGTDKQGRAVSVIVGSKHSKSKRDLEETKRLICYCLDAAIDRCDLSKNPTGKVVAVFDLRGINTDAMDTSALHAVFDLMQNHYPERLGMLWMYEASFLFHSIWKVVSPFIDAATKAKIKFIGKESVSELQNVIGPATLPKELGGQAEMIPTQDAVAQMRADSSRTSPADQQQAQEGGQHASHRSAAFHNPPGGEQIGGAYGMGEAQQEQRGQQPFPVGATGNKVNQSAEHSPPAERLPQQFSMLHLPAAQKTPYRAQSPRQGAMAAPLQAVGQPRRHLQADPTANHPHPQQGSRSKESLEKQRTRLYTRPGPPEYSPNHLVTGGPHLRMIEKQQLSH